MSIGMAAGVTARLGDGMIGWAAGAAMAAVLALCIRAIRQYYYSRPSAALWGVGAQGAEYEIVLPARTFATDETKATGWPWVPMGDAYAAALLVQALRTLKRSVRVEIYAASELPPEKRARSNVVCVGGPNFNPVTAQLMAELSVPLSFTHDPRAPGHPVMEAGDGFRFVSDVEQNAEGWQLVRSDWGAVVVAPSPYPDARRANRRVFIVMGNGSQGTVAAARVLSLPDRQPLGPALWAYLRLRPARARVRDELYSREILAALRESGKCAVMFCSRVEQGYVSYPHQSERVAWGESPVAVGA
jgi:hypothetical protein